MPLYEYQCTACGKLTEKRQKFSDPEITECPHCGGHLERTITAPAVQFKGGGWYADLYSSGKKAAPKSSEGGSSGEGGGTGTESKSGAAESAGGSKTDSAAAPPAASTAPSKPASTPTPST